MEPLIKHTAFKGGKLELQYSIGSPSWHQRKAGHGYAAKMTAFHSYDEYRKFLANTKKEYITVKILDETQS